MTNVEEEFNMFNPNYERKYQTVASLLKQVLHVVLSSLHTHTHSFISYFLCLTFYRYVKQWRHKAEEKDTTNTRSAQLPYLFGDATRNQGDNTT